MPAWLSAIPLVGKIADGIFGLIDQAVEDKDEAARMKTHLEEIFAKIDHKEFTTMVTSQTRIILQEARGGWLQRNWRPVLMWAIIAIIVNNYIIAPYVGLFFPTKELYLELPQPMWALLTIGVGGYIGGRTWEKIKKAT